MTDTDDSDSSSDYKPFLANSVPGGKQPRHHCTTYNIKWETNYSWIERYEPNNGYAHCKLCLTTFSIAHGGAHDVKRHQETVKHKKAANISTLDSNNCTSTISMTVETNFEDTDADKFKSPNNSIVASVGNASASKTNRKKYMIAYNPKWEADFPWLRPAAHSGSAHCILCKGDFSIEYRGLHDVIRHIDRMKHRKALENPNASSSIDPDDLTKSESNALFSKTYNANWELRFSWIKPTRSIYSAECTVCSAVFSIQHRGLADVERHQERAKHKKAMEMLQYKSENISGIWSDSDEPLSKFSNVKRSKRKNGGESSSSTIRAKKEKIEESTEDYFENTSALYWDSFMANTKQEPNMSDYDDVDNVDDDNTYDPNVDYNEPSDPISFEAPFETVNVATLPVIHTNATKQIRMATYNPNWELMYPWLCADEQNPANALCTICNSNFSINYRGIHDVKRHEYRQKHIKYAKMQRQIAPKVPNMKRLRVAEATHVFHSIVHGHSLASTDCVERLYGQFFSDSYIAKKFSCDRVKASQIVHSVFVPIAQNKIISDLSNNHPFSIATNTANCGNIGTFPIIVRYYQHNGGGVKNKILTYFTPLSSETFQDIYLAIIKELEGIGLNIKNVTAFAADNTAINFKHNESVFSELVKLNGNLLPMNCLRRSIQNAFQLAQKFLKFDIEMIVYKCFNELSSTLDPIPDELRSFYEWLKDDWPDILRSIPTQWLTILQAVAQFLHHFSALKIYFLSKSDVTMHLQQFFHFELAECYMGLFKFIGDIFQTANTRLGISEKASGTDLYDTMHDLHASLNSKRNNRSYGSVAANRLIQIDNIVLIDEFHRDAYVYFDAAIKYLEKCYDFGNMAFKCLNIMQLPCKPALEDFQQIVNFFNINDIMEKELFEEYQILSSYYDSNHLFNSGANLNVAAQQWWSWFFQSNRSPNFERICNYVFSIPISCSVAERVCHELWKGWQSDRNIQVLANLKANLLVKENLGSMTCMEFSNCLKTSPIMDTMLTKEEQYDANA